MKASILPAIIFLSFILTGCSKKVPGEKDIIAPVVNIASPLNAQIFTGGQNINITGTITDDKYIAEVHIHVSNTATGSLLMDIHLYPATNIVNFNQSINAVSGTNYKILVTAKDKAINEGRSSVEVAAN
jgi:hypothetical protein